MSARRLGVLVRTLPLESQTARGLGAFKPGDWTNTEELLARTVDELAAANYYFLKAHARRGTVVREPKPIPRPASAMRQTPPKPAASADQLAAFVGRKRKGLGPIIDYTPKGGPP